ncbi:VOC family protein [Myxococcus sp. Y35]|uniref:VOC family protein n=1 Tax=Pseudomyxococcus flavus TaxID=3115648 RepID=UPI003CEC6054
MEPRGDARPYGGGATLNVLVEDVDALYQRMTERGEQMVIPLADNPWGDRGFGVLDPIGLVVYCHKVIPPSAEFRRFIQSAPDAVRGA